MLHASPEMKCERSESVQITWAPWRARGYNEHQEHYKHGSAGITEVAAVGLIAMKQ